MQIKGPDTPGATSTRRANRLILKPVDANETFHTDSERPRSEKATIVYSLLCLNVHRKDKRLPTNENDVGTWLMSQSSSSGASFDRAVPSSSPSNILKY